MWKIPQNWCSLGLKCKINVVKNSVLKYLLNQELIKQGNHRGTIDMICWGKMSENAVYFGETKYTFSEDNKVSDILYLSKNQTAWKVLALPIFFARRDTYGRAAWIGNLLHG